MDETELDIYALAALPGSDAYRFIRERKEALKAELDRLPLSHEEGRDEALEIVRRIQAMSRLLDDIDEFAAAAKMKIEGQSRDGR
jgi:hypothetical protein